MGTRDRIIELHKRGLANTQIARVVGVTRQRVWAVLSTKRTKPKVETSVMSITGVAAILGVHPNTLRRWSNEGLIPCFRVGPRQDRRFDRQLVLETIRKGTP
jgi:excisionase family DNA binding protein